MAQKRELKPNKGEENIHWGGGPAQSVCLSWGQNMSTQGEGIQAEMEEVYTGG